MEAILSQLQVNIPFRMLYDRYLEGFLEAGLNPEIGIDAQALERFSHGQFERVAAKLKACGLRITLHGPFMDLSPGSEDPEIAQLTRMRFEQMLRLVPVFKPVSVVCHAGYDWRRYGYNRERWLEKSAAVWAWLARRIADQGSRLVLENVYERSPQELLALFAKLEGFPIGFCLDIGHQAVFGCTPLAQWLQDLGPYLEQLHLHDNNGDKDAHLALGQGGIDFDSLLPSLQQRGAGRPFLFTLEIRSREDLKSSLGFLKERWPWRHDQGL